MFGIDSRLVDAAVAGLVGAYVLRGGRPTAGMLALTVYGAWRLQNTELNAEKDVEQQEIKTGATAETKTAAKRTRRVKRIKTSAETFKKQKQTVATSKAPVTIFYSSLTGATERAAKYLNYKLVEQQSRNVQLLNLDDEVDDLDEFFVKVQQKHSIYVLVLPSYETDSPLDYFLQTLEENSTDFRIDSYPMRQLLGFSVIGLGDKEQYPEKFCYQAVKADELMSNLGGKRLFPLGKFCTKTDGDAAVQQWCDLYSDTLNDDEMEYLDDESENDEIFDKAESGDGNDSSSESSVVDIEDMGKMMDSTEKAVAAVSKPEIKEMVAKDSPTYKSLTKQGYTVVGSHSGVKICRWTKSALRNRGSCYKYAFYGIRSHLCMETTPSLSCSNKCVFCWRHGTNPVGTSWRWQVDGPEEVLKGALEGHYKKIKQMRGVPGIHQERFQEAFRVRHCALSLVGEPIFYPHINEFVGMLHEREISSFLVCNAQHPEQLANMNRVTQLYVSIDAPSRGELKKVDRPLFRDFWERLQKCLEILNTVQKKQRTVFRLTLVKDFNMGEVSGYADMICKANPSLVEIKGATFCGSSSGNGNPLTMQNIPFYEECKNFVESLNQELANRGMNYGIAAEHAHSCCILMAHKKFEIHGKWHTHIDYPKFFELLKSGEDFDELDYCKETPEWAYWGSKEAGFSPEDVRYNRKEEKAKKKREREAGIIQ